MAIHAHSTTAPTRALLRLVPDLATIEAEFAGLIAQPWPEGDLAQVAHNSDVPNQPENFGLDADYPDMAGVAVSKCPPGGHFASLSAAADLETCSTCPGLSEARALHLRRELHQALDFGFALLDALDLSPRGLDIIDGAIARLDAMDAPDEEMEEGGDAEPSLGWTPHIYQTAFNIGDTADIELDTADAEDDDPAEAEPDMEASIGWPNDFTAVVEHRFDTTDTDIEEVNEDGDDCGETNMPWWDRIGYPVMEGVHG